MLLNGEPVSACQVSAGDLAGAAVVTVEGLARGERLSPVQRAFAERGAFQCGFCTPGMVVAMTALLQRNPAPSTDQVRDALQGHLCRCCGYPRILEAAHRASELTRAGEGGP